MLESYKDIAESVGLLADWSDEQFLEESEYVRCTCTEAEKVINELRKRVSAYEDTGLEPEEVEAVHKGLHDFYELEAKGRLVVFPLGIGDTFYNIERFCDGSTGDCDSWVPCDRCPDYEPEIIERKIRTITQAAHVMESLNNTAFLTREEAESALKGENT